MKKNFEFRSLRSNSKSIVFQCIQEGCKWYIRTSRYKESELWMLRKYVSNNDCSMNTVQISYSSSSLIGDCLKDEFRLSSFN